MVIAKSIGTNAATDKTIALFFKETLPLSPLFLIAAPAIKPEL
jgi:hypothetical protein